MSISIELNNALYEYKMNYWKREISLDINSKEAEDFRETTRKLLVIINNN